MSNSSKSISINLPTVIKKDGEPQEWNFHKVERAISLAGQRVNRMPSSSELQDIENTLLKIVPETVKVIDLHDLVCQVLDTYNYQDIANSYREFRNYKKDFDQMFDEIYRQTNKVLMSGDRENANFESTLVSTKGSIIRGYLSKEIFKRFHLSREEQEAIHEGYYYIHDMRDLLFNTFNCCLFDMATVMKGGFKMASINYKEPSTFFTACQVVSKIIINTTAQQFGGFTVPDIDKILVPYLQKTRAKYVEISKKFIEESKRNEFVNLMIAEELRKGMTAIECDVNTVSTSRGDFAFTTFSFGNLDEPAIFEDQKMICEAILKVRMRGHGKGEPVPFPKLVFLFNHDVYENSASYNDLVEVALECSSKCMYPDFLSLQTGKVADYYKESGQVVSPMGCRAYLSPAYKDQFISERNPKGMYFTGRGNVGAVSLNLPMIYQKAKVEGLNFYDVLTKYATHSMNFLKKRYSAVANSKVSQNPMCFNQGGLVGGTKGLDECVGWDIVKDFTAGLGITALNELNVLHEGKPLHESDQKFVNEVIDFLDDLRQKYNAENQTKIALYGTPAESLCGTQAKQFREKFGVVKGVSDRKYFSNSFHMHVTADITPFKKQDLEFKLFHKLEGGHIQYVRLANVDNKEAIRSTMLRGMRMGFYQGYNFQLVICSDCGHRIKSDESKGGKRAIEHTFCPQCHSTNLMGQERTCGYLSFSKLEGDTRFGEAKMAEIRERISM